MIERGEIPDVIVLREEHKGKDLAALAEEVFFCVFFSFSSVQRKIPKNKQKKNNNKGRSDWYVLNSSTCSNQVRLRRQAHPERYPRELEHTASQARLQTVRCHCSGQSGTAAIRGIQCT